MGLFNQRGQGMVESLVSIPVLLLCVSGLGYLLYFILNYQVASYHLHEALLCSQSKPRQACRAERLSGLQRLLIFNETLEFRIFENRQSIKGTVKLGLRPPIKINLQVPREF